jgi:hypothetical protein
MRTISAMLVVALLGVAGCRESRGTTDPGDTDAGQTPADTGSATDVGGATDLGGGGADRACVPSGPENTASTCGDGVDNDCDNFVDCMDFDCSRNNPAVTFCGDAGAGRTDRGPCTPSGMENTAAACMDGIDNDCNGFVDCNDFACSRNNPAVTHCGDAGAGRTDRGPCTPMGAENTASACGDRIDNDCDGFVDCNDFDCSRNNPAVTTCGDAGATGDRGACTPSGAENTSAACMDGVDNDCDGFTDCMDFDCSRNNPAVTHCGDAGAPRDTGPRDVITFVDAGPRADATGCTRMGEENTPAACMDGIDNDCDGYTDCSDRNCSCQGACGAAVQGCTCRGAENTNGTCGDGIDNDCNSFVDCRDFSCSMNTAVNVCMDAGR